MRPRPLDWRSRNIGVIMSTTFSASSDLSVRNEIVRDYTPGSSERRSLQAALAEMASVRIELPLVIGGREVTTGRLAPSISPHAHGRILGDAHSAGPDEVRAAIAAAKAAWPDWSRTGW